MTHTSTEQQIAAAWNAQADEFNQWDELDLEEKIEWAAKLGASQAQRVPLSAEDVRAMADVAGYFAPFDRARFIDGVRHAEAAHGITQEKQG